MSIDEAFEQLLDMPELREKIGIKPGHWRVLRHLQKNGGEEIKTGRKAKWLKLAGFTEIAYWIPPAKETPAVETEGV